MLLDGAAAIAADAGQVTRTSFVDLDDDIVQVELAGPGTVSVVLEDASGPAPPIHYNQHVLYMKGHAGLIVAGATADTHVSVFCVGRATAFDLNGGFSLLQPITAANHGSPLFRTATPVTYDGRADIAFIAILSVEGKFGSLRTANVVSPESTPPGVEFIGPVYVGTRTAFEEANPRSSPWGLLSMCAPQASISSRSTPDPCKSPGLSVSPSSPAAILMATRFPPRPTKPIWRTTAPM